jgi:hypothetical protein
MSRAERAAKAEAFRALHLLMAKAWYAIEPAIGYSEMPQFMAER